MKEAPLSDFVAARRARRAREVDQELAGQPRWYVEQVKRGILELEFGTAYKPAKVAPVADFKRSDTSGDDFKTAKLKKPALRTAVISNSVQSIRLKGSRLKLKLGLQFCSVNAIRVVLALVFRVYAMEDSKFEMLRITASDLNRVLNIGYRMTRAQIESLLAEVAGVVFTVRSDDRFAAIPALAIAEFKPGIGIIRLRLNPELRNYFLNLSDYRTLNRKVFRLRSARGVLLYMRLRRFVGRRYQKPTGAIPVKDLCQELRSPQGQPWSDFRKDALDPALADINKRTELSVTYQPIRGGRLDRKRGEVDAVLFNVRERKQLKLKNPQQG